MLTQTLAIFIDAYRELNAKRLFWVVLAISVLVVAAFAAVGINDRGLTVLWWSFDFPLNSTWMPEALFYKMLFVNLGIVFWLSWLASILALVSTAGIFPDFLAGGAIELSLSKPIGRARLFLSKYLAGLLFVGLQVGLFSLASFLVIGLRGGVWESGVFLAVPLVVLFFSYLFGVCVLLGLLTRSTIASLLFTLLFWLAIFGLHTTESVFLGITTQGQLQREAGLRERGEVLERIAALERGEAALTPPADSEPKPTEGGMLAMLSWAATNPPAPEEDAGQRELDDARARLEQIDRRLEQGESRQRSMSGLHRWFFIAKTVLPKTSETTALMSRVLVSQADLEAMSDARGRGEAGPGPFRSSDEESFAVDPRELEEEMERVIRRRSVGWIIGTSLGFEALVVGLACWLFCRRDF